MKKLGIIIGGIIVIGLIMIVSSIFYVMNIYNGEVKLANRYDAQFNVVETTLDTMRKTLINQFKVNKKYADDFIRVAIEQNKGRAGGALFKSNRESESLGIKPELYSKMMNAISGQLSQFKRSQDILTDVWRQHKTYCETMPNSFFVGSKIKPKPVMISSSVTKKAIETKQVDDNLLGE